MANFLEKVAHLLVGDEPSRHNLSEIQVNFIDNKKVILDHLERCKRSRGVLGVYSRSLGQGMFLTTVEEIHKIGPDTLIDLKPYDFKEGFLKSVTISIKDIKYICPFNQVLS